MGENKEFILIEKDVWESVCSRVTALSQKIRAYEQTHQPVPQYYNNKEGSSDISSDATVM